MDSVRVLLVLSLVLVIAVDTGLCIWCHECNSGDIYEGEECADPLTKSFKVDCDEKTKTSGMNYTYCRKMIQDVESEVRIVRQCANEGRVNKCMERTGTYKIRLTYCLCDEDECNTASMPTGGTVQILLLTVVSALLGLLFNS